MAKMKEKKYDVFISYRRHGGYETAQAVKAHLEQKGYRVFLDVETLRSGLFDEKLYQAIEQSVNFVVILNAGSLERCFQKDDWVYKEITHALKTERNIIPIMLTGFVWPKEIPEVDEAQRVSDEMAREISETIQKLSMYNGISPGPETFTDSMNRLRKMLHRSWGLYLTSAWLKITGVLLLCLLLVCGGIYANRVMQLREFSSASKAVSSLMALQISEMDVLVRKLKSLEQKWDDFIVKMRADRKNRERYVTEIGQEIEHEIHFIETQIKKLPIIKPEEKILSVLQKNGTDMADIQVFYDFHCPQFRDMCLMTLKELREYANIIGQQPSFLDTVNRFAKNQLEANVLQAKISYIGFLCILKTFPASVYPEVRHVLGQTFIGEGIAMEQSLDDLTQQMHIFMEKQKHCMLELNEDIHDEEKLNAELEAYLEDWEKDSESQKEEAESLEEQVNNQVSQIQKTYQEALEKFAFAESDDSWKMWGKTIRIASFLRLNLATRIVAPEMIYRDIAERLDEMAKRSETTDPNIVTCAGAMKHYFRLLLDGKIEDVGVIVYMIENNAEHPFLKPGDIILKTNDHNVMTGEDMERYANQEKPNRNLRLRTNEKGESEITEYTTQPGTPKVMYVDLRE